MKKLSIIAAALLLLLIPLTALATNSNNQRGVADLAYMSTANYPTKGNYVYVDNANPNAQDSWPQYGGSWDRPLNTIDYAIGRSGVTNNHDIIFVGPNHVETISTEGAITLDVPGMQIIGLGTGLNRPTIIWGSTASGVSASIIVNAMNTGIRGLILDMTRVNGVRTGVSVTSNSSGFTVSDSIVLMSDDYDNGHAMNALLYEAGGTHYVIDNTQFIGSGLLLSAVSAAVRIETGVSDFLIKDCYFSGYTDTTTLAQHGAFIDGASSAVSQVVIQDCIAENYNSGGSPFYFGTVSGVTAVDGMAYNVVSKGNTRSGTTVITMRVQDYSNTEN